MRGGVGMAGRQMQLCASGGHGGWEPAPHGAARGCVQRARDQKEPGESKRGSGAGRREEEKAGAVASCGDPGPDD
eukprot:10330124-Heterocapsa_arctica.AAC.1